MQFDLKGKTAIVTGGSKGIGYAVARGLAKNGADVTIVGRTQADVDQALDQLRTGVDGGSFTGVACDLGTPEGAKAVIDHQRQTDILINNAGIFGFVPFTEITDEDWYHIMEVNFMAGVRLSRHYLPGMIERNWGRILFTSSESGLNIPVDMIHYGVTKTAYLALARGLAKLAAGTGVTVNAILPGPTLSDGVKDLMGGEAKKAGKSLAEFGAEFVRTQRPTSILRRFAQPDEVASLFLYACSPEASATTGAALRADGGIVESLG